jgi:putative ABC transport system substrate-binding protein
MRRREFIALAALHTTLSAAGAQQTRQPPKVGYLFSFTPAEGQHFWEACRLGLQQLGYVEDVNIVLEPRWADGDHARLPQLVQELVAVGVHVIVAAATPANLAAKMVRVRRPL